jgi:hypothetical protein
MVCPTRREAGFVFFNERGEVPFFLWPHVASTAYSVPDLAKARRPRYQKAASLMRRNSAKEEYEQNYHRRNRHWAD